MCHRNPACWLDCISGLMLDWQNEKLNEMGTPWNN
ncbi:hypothetical protein MTsN2n4_28140 [Pseudoalteromonas sp. MTN2-4]